MDSWWHFLWGCLAALLIYSLTYQLSGTMIGAMGFPATVTFFGLRIGISTLRFSASSFLALFGSSYLHLFMDSEDLDERSYIGRNYNRNTDMPSFEVFLLKHARVKRLRRIFVFIFSLIPDYIFAYIMFLIKLGYFPNFKNPKSFNEKLNYIKLYTRNELRRLTTDRLKIRDYVIKNSGCKLINILYYGTEFTQKDWCQLPEEFVIKANHGSGMVLIVNKSIYNYEYVSNVVNSWLKIDFSKLVREWFYHNARRIIIVEEKLTFDGKYPPDFKFFCMNGTVELVQVDIDRFSEHLRNLYTRDFKRIDASYIYKQGPNVEKPINYDLAVKYAEELSVDFDFIRVDLYLLNNGVYFGELTNTPDNGCGSFNPRELDFKLGAKLTLGMN